MENRKLVMSQTEIEEAAKRVGQEISKVIKDEKKIPILIGVLKGSVNFLVDLMKHIDVEVYTDYMQIKSYEGTSSTGTIQLLKDVSFDLKDRVVIIVEDIVDSGLTMDFLINHLSLHGPKKVYVCALIDKINARKIPVKVDFVGKILEKNDFLIGHGLDYNDLSRNLPYIYSATPEDVARLNKVLEEDKK